MKAYWQKRLFIIFLQKSFPENLPKTSTKTPLAKTLFLKKEFCHWHFPRGFEKQVD